MKAHREGKITLRSYKVELTPLPKVDSKLILDTRKKLHYSRAVFARKLRLTKERWRNGSRGGRNRILRQRRSCCWCGGIRTRWRGWMRWRRGKRAFDCGRVISPQLPSSLTLISEAFRVVVVHPYRAQWPVPEEYSMLQSQQFRAQAPRCRLSIPIALACLS
jgi:hypothetical protein